MNVFEKTFQQRLHDPNSFSVATAKFILDYAINADSASNLIIPDPTIVAGPTFIFGVMPGNMRLCIPWLIDPYKIEPAMRKAGTFHRYVQDDFDNNSLKSAGNIVVPRPSEDLPDGLGAYIWPTNSNKHPFVGYLFNAYGNALNQQVPDQLAKITQNVGELALVMDSGQDALHVMKNGNTEIIEITKYPR